MAIAAVLALCVGLLTGFVAFSSPSRAQASAPVVLLDVRDAIGPATADYVARGLDTAAEAGAPLVVIALDTPGGLDAAMRQIIQAILASPVPVAVYVSPAGARAASAGTYILYSAHVAAMAPATTLGAATPVAIGLPGLDRRPLPPAPPASEGSASAPAATPADTLTAKQVHDAAAFIRGLAAERGRNAEWAERAVREAVSLTAEEALRANVIDLVARDLPDLLKQLDGHVLRVRGTEVTLATHGLAVETVLPDWRHRLLAAITQPGVALILMMLGIYGLLFEFASPGFGVAGVAGAICLLLALFALQMLPVNYVGLALIGLAVALWVAELLAPGFGVLGVGGVVAFIAGGLLLFEREAPGFRLPLSVIVGMAAASAGLILAGGHLALRARRGRVVSGREEMVGARGEVLEVEGANVWARVHGERWHVRSRTPLAPGQAVRVTALDGLTLDVRPDDEPATKGVPS